MLFINSCLFKIELQVTLKEVFYKKRFIKSIQLQAFNKTTSNPHSNKEQYFYFLKHQDNMENNMEQPANEEELSYHNLSLVEIAKLSYEEYPRYKLSRMQYLEIKAMYQNGYEEGLNAGRKLLEEIRAEREEIRKETERIRAETEKIRTKKEEPKAVTEEVRAEIDKIRKEAEEIRAETEKIKKKTEEYIAKAEEINISMRKTAKAILQSGSSKEEIAKAFSISLEELEAWLNHP